MACRHHDRTINHRTTVEGQHISYPVRRSDVEMRFARYVHLDRSRTSLWPTPRHLRSGDTRTVHLPPLFWWQGLDGSRVLTMHWTIYGNVYGNVVLGNRWVD
jgi:hypothetical protein